nr:hypothetical protein [Tanacetum cinerariifolium]
MRLQLLMSSLVEEDGGVVVELKHDDVSGCPISGAVVDSLEEIARILCDYCDESFKDLRDSTLYLCEKHPCLFYPLVADIAEITGATNDVVSVSVTSVLEDEDVVVLVSATNVSKGTDDHVSTVVHEVKQFESASKRTCEKRARVKKEPSTDIHLKIKTSAAKRHVVCPADISYQNNMKSPGSNGQNVTGDVAVSIKLMRYFSFGRHLEEIYMPWTHLEKKRTRLRTYTNISQEYAYKAWRLRHKIHVTQS